MRSDPSPGHVPRRIAPAALRLWAARAVAWSLLFGGWIVLGTLGRQHLAALAGGQLPVALWLLTIGVGLTLAAPWRWHAASLRTLLLLAGGVGAAALIGVDRSALALPVAAVAWAALMVVASFTVRTLRRAHDGAPPSPTGPALAGALLAWWLAGDLEALRHAAAPPGLALAAAALLLAALLPARATAQGACRAGLFDCSLPLQWPARWADARDWPLAAAALGMLPMMASLPLMADWCGPLRWPAPLASALHLAAMLLPAACMSRTLPSRRPALASGVALVLGGAALFAPGVSGLMAASLLHGLAWSFAWGALLTRPKVERTTNTPPWIAALLSAVGVLLLGIATDRAGPAALTAVHGALAGLGLVGLLAACLRGLGHRMAPVLPESGEP